MLPRFNYLLPLLVLIVTSFGCAGPKVSEAPSTSSMAGPVRVESAGLAVELIRISEKGDNGTLVDDPGWREYVLQFQNVSTNDLTIENVKLLNQNGRYVNSASAYEQIIAPPDVGAELAGDVAGKAAGQAAGQVIPYGGAIFSVLSKAASARSAVAKADAKNTFMMRVLKNVELAPDGKVEGSAFLPNITRPVALVVDYAQEGMPNNRIEIPLPSREP